MYAGERRRIIAFLLFLITLVLLGSLIVLSSLFLHLSAKKSSQRSGSVDSSDELDPRKRSDGSTILSMFGNLDHICTGSCFCYDDENRRTVGSSSVIRKGLILLTTAATSLTAMRKAEEYFTRECIQELEDDCSFSSIHSIVEICEEDTSTNIIINEDSESYQETSATNIRENESSDPDDRDDFVDYSCSGRCTGLGILRKKGIWGDILTHNSELLESFGSIGTFWFLFQGITFKADSFMDHFCGDLKLTKSIKMKSGKGKVPDEMMEARAIDTFRMVHLHKFCKMHSFTGFDEIFERFYPHELMKEYDEKRRKESIVLWEEFFERYADKIHSSEGINICKPELVENGYEDDDGLFVLEKNISCVRQSST